MAELGELQLIYQEYEEKLSEARKKAGMFAGAFNMGDDPRKDACNQVFYEKVEQWTEEFVKLQPDSSQAAQAVGWILEYPAGHRERDSYWMTYAAQKFAGKLIPMLTAADAKRMETQFHELYPKKDRMPVQRELDGLFRERTGEKAIDENRLFKIWVPRVILLLVGLTIAHLGVTLFLLASLGSDPFNVLIQGLHRLIGSAGLTMLTHGTVHIAISLLIILVLLVVDRSYVRIGTFLCMILGGPIIDVFNLMLKGVVNETSPMPVRILAVALGCGILAFGMTIVIKSQAGTGPNDLVAVVLSEKRHWPFGIVRIGVDLLFALVGFALGGVVGLGTIICMAVVGPVAQLFMPISEKLCKQFVNRQ